MWPETTLLLPVWPQDAKSLDTPYPNNWKNRVAICELEKTAKRENLRERSESPVLDIITLKCALDT